MNRRQFTQTVLGSSLGAAALAGAAADGQAQGAARSQEADLPFKFSVMLWTVYRDLPFAQRLEKVVQAGYRAVELVGEFKRWSEEDWQAAMRTKQSLGITFDATAGLRYGVGDPGAREALLADLREMLKTCERLECPAIIVLSGNRIPELGPEAQHHSCVEGLKQAGDIAAKQNVKLLLENINPQENPKYYLTSSAEGFQIIEEVNHPAVLFLYDFFHEQISHGNLIEKLEKNIARVGTVHIADVPGRHEPGTGEINYASIFRKLGQLKFSGYAAMEFVPTGDPVETLRAAREMAARAARG
jgi:hydroxypyruvate isomerase